jgi:MerR family copper efflux transcriptional regulator
MVLKRPKARYAHPGQSQAKHLRVAADRDKKVKTMNIGQAAKSSGVSAKMIRHYESIGLFTKISRADSGYRVYGENEVHSLTFVRRARDLGFSMKEIKKLLNLWRNKARPSFEVKKLALEHVRDLDQKIFELRAMVNSLRTLALKCNGDDRPECPILGKLGEDKD